MRKLLFILLMPFALFIFATSATDEIVKVGCGEYLTNYVTSDGNVYGCINADYSPYKYPVSNAKFIAGGQYTNSLVTDSGCYILDKYGNAKQVRDETGKPIKADRCISSYETHFFYSANSLQYYGSGNTNFPGAETTAKKIALPANKKIADVACSDIGNLILFQDSTVYILKSYNSGFIKQNVGLTIRIAAIGKGCFIAETKSQLLAWGTNANYVGLNWNTTIPADIRNQFAGAQFPSKQIIGNYNTFHLIDRNGLHYAIGDNSQGEIGNGQEIDYKNYSPQFAWTWYPLQKYQSATLIPGKLNEIFTSNSIAFYLYAKDSANRLGSWGRNKARSLGNGITLTPDLENKYPNFSDVTKFTPVSPLTTKWTVINSFDPNNPTLPTKRFVATATYYDGFKSVAVNLFSDSTYSKQ